MASCGRPWLSRACRASAVISIREVTDPDDPGLKAFGKLQRAVYFEPDALIPGEWLGRMLEFGSEERHNFVLLAESDSTVVGGTVFHYLAEPNSGFSSFMGVALEARGQGVARQLHDARWSVLRGQGPVEGVFIDVVNPTRLSEKELAREKAVGSDPWIRRRVFAHLGFRQVDIRYEQPVGGPNGGPVTNLDLLVCPPVPAETVPTDLVVNTMLAYWQPWLGDQRARRHANELRRRANHSDHVRLVSPEP